jgi:chromosome segregation ATPase
LYPVVPLSSASASLTTFEITATVQDAVQQQSAQWETALQGAATPLQQQIEALQQQQAGAARFLEAADMAAGEMQEQQQQLSQRLATVEGQLGAAATSSDMRALQQQVDGIAVSLAAIPQPYDDTALAGRVADVEGTLQSSLAEVHAAMGAADPLLGQQLSQLQQEVAALDQSMAALQAAAATAGAAAKEKGAAEADALAQLSAAVGKLSQGQAALESMLESVGQVCVGSASPWSRLLSFAYDASML